MNEKNFNTEKYKSAFSKEAYFKKIKEISGPLLENAKLLWKYFQSPDIGGSHKGLILASLGYLIVPTDLVLDFIPVAGYLDDLAVLSYVISKCTRGIRKIERNRSYANN